jgi:GT2 family glycosyltransferase
LIDAKEQIELTIVILTWNSKSYLTRCVRSIFATVKDCQYEIILIDNNSTDGTIKIIKKLSGIYPLRSIFNTKNEGVAKGRNKGIIHSNGKYVLLLDVDTFVTPKAVKTLLEYMKGNSQCGLVAPKLVSVDSRTQNTCRRFPTLLTKLKRRMPIRCHQENVYDYEIDGNHSKKIFEVDYAIGACQLIRKSIIGDVGLLDENIFYGPEDIDFCLRIWKHGYRVVYNANAVVVHHEQRITKKKLISKLSVNHFIGICYYFYKHRYLFSTIKLDIISKPSRVSRNS